MGKKGKGAKKEKEDKPKREPAPRDKVKEALEATNVTASAAPAPHASYSKKSERSSSLPIKIGCTESFRWDNSEEAPMLPPMPRLPQAVMFHVLRHRTRLVFMTYLQHGWEEYLKWRCGDATLAASAMRNKTLKDGLSAPLTIASMVLYWMAAKDMAYMGEAILDDSENGEPLHIVVVGATAVNEEKILRESNYWEEIFNIMDGRKLHLYLTGPEMSGRDGVFKSETIREKAEGPEMKVECWKANGVDFFLQEGRLEQFRKEDTVVVGLNCGFGLAMQHLATVEPAKHEPPSNEVVWKWIPTLYFLAALDLPFMITGCCAEDVKYAHATMAHVVGTYEVLGMKLSPVHSESEVSGDQALRANSHFFIVQGQRPGFHFSVQQLSESEKDLRIETLRKTLAGKDASQQCPMHVSVTKPGDKRERVSSLTPLKRYGKYPPDKVPKKEDRASNGDVSAPVTRGREVPVKVELKYEFFKTSDGGSDALEMIVEDVFMTDPAKARVGMRKSRVVLHYHDIRRFRDVVFEAALPKEVDHATTKVVFRRSDRTLKIVVRLLDSNK